MVEELLGHGTEWGFDAESFVAQRPDLHGPKAGGEQCGGVGLGRARERGAGFIFSLKEMRLCDIDAVHGRR
jgi:hypothetical protein